jgi:hypothetical protein
VKRCHTADSEKKNGVVLHSIVIVSVVFANPVISDFG